MPPGHSFVEEQSPLSPTPLLRTLLILWLVGLSLRSEAQRDTAFYRTAPVPAHLRPIERAIGSSALGSVYFYGGKRLHSPYSLEVPFYELNDPQVTQHFRNFRTWTTVGRLAAVIPVIFFLTRTSSNGFNPREYWSVSGGSLILSFGAAIVANTQVNRGVARYNTMLRQVQTGQLRVGAAAATTPFGGQVIGIGGAFTFP